MVEYYYPEEGLHNGICVMRSIIDITVIRCPCITHPVNGDITIAVRAAYEHATTHTSTVFRQYTCGEENYKQSYTYIVIIKYCKDINICRVYAYNYTHKQWYTAHIQVYAHRHAHMQVYAHRHAHAAIQLLILTLSLVRYIQDLL